jgi:tetratricopeptide (TPR) repeat protein
LGQFDEALAHYNIADKHMKGLKSNSMNEDALRGDILFNRGQTYAATGNADNYRKSIIDFEAALELQGNNNEPVVRHKTLFNLGIVYRRIGDPVKSIENLKKATSLG